MQISPGSTHSDRHRCDRPRLRNESFTDRVFTSAVSSVQFWVRIAWSVCAMPSLGSGLRGLAAKPCAYEIVEKLLQAPGIAMVSIAG